VSAPSPRRAAADVLVAVLDAHRPLENALAQAPAFAALAGRDRAFARAITSTTLRRLGGIDAVLSRFIARSLPGSARFARALLRSGAAQLLVLGTPAHAAVSEAVDLAQADRGAAPYAKLVNAVLRRVATEGPALFAAQPAGADLPSWLFARWCAAYGADGAADIALALQREPPLDLTVKHDPGRWAKELGGTVLPTGSVRLPPGAHAVDALPGYAEGAWWVQDAAAALPARLFGEAAGKRVLDLCAAPGGKTLQLANAGARVTAVDASARRLRRLEENLARTSLDAEIVVADALAYAPAAPFDVVLLDAPCTATGTLRRRPDVAWSKTPADIATLAQLQTRLIAAAGRMLGPGGRLIYCVCSLEPEEGEGAVKGALAGAVLAPDPIAPGEVPGLPAEALTAEGAVRTLPSMWPEAGGMDGFYIARMQASADRSPE
jgi:16S rRNA (cytosine967-C5)-methyltransferase